MGRTTTKLDLRNIYKTTTKQNKPDLLGSDLWVDPEFPIEVAMEGMKESGISWKRPTVTYFP